KQAKTALTQRSSGSISSRGICGRSLCSQASDKDSVESNLRIDSGTSTTSSSRRGVHDLIATSRELRALLVQSRGVLEKIKAKQVKVGGGSGRRERYEMRQTGLYFDLG